MLLYLLVVIIFFSIPTSSIAGIETCGKKESITQESFVSDIEVSTNLSWVKSNKRLYIRKWDGKLYRAYMSSDRLDVIGDHFFRVLLGPEISPDRRYVQYSGRRKEDHAELAFIHDTFKNKTTQIFLGKQFGDFGVAEFSPDSTKLAFLDFSENTGVIIVDLNDFNQTLISYPRLSEIPQSDLRSVGDLMWSKDGKYIYVYYVGDVNEEYKQAYYKINVSEKSFQKINGHDDNKSFRSIFVEDGVVARTHIFQPTGLHEKLESPSGGYALIDDKYDLLIGKNNNNSILIENGDVEISPCLTMSNIHIIDWIEDGNYLLYEFQGRKYIYGVKEKKKSELVHLKNASSHDWLFDSGE
ncbi:MAG: hypothetical protein ACRBDL_11505 [Alphaproteobacteria bacterium]